MAHGPSQGWLSFLLDPRQIDPRMNIKEILTIWPVISDHWATELGSGFFWAREKDLDANGWLDPWTRPLDKQKLITQKKPTPEGWIARTTTVSLESKNDIVHVKLVVYTIP